MKILVLGATGYIGRHVVACLSGEGHDVIGAVRDVGSFRRRFGGLQVRQVDLRASDTDWSALVEGVDVIINCAGILTGAHRAVHVKGPQSLYYAAAGARVRQVILLSAISADADAGTDYASSKLAGEQVLQQQEGLEHVILRPSLVHGPGSYGGTSLMRGFAGLPFVMPVVGKGDQLFAPIDMDDLTGLISRCADQPERFNGQILSPQGPEQVSLAEILRRLRGWLDIHGGIVLHVPKPLVRIVCRMGDVLPMGPINSVALQQIEHGNTGDYSAFEAQAGFSPKSHAEALAARPSTVQDRWHARLWGLKPLSTLALVLIWLSAGVIGLITGLPEAAAVTRLLQLPDGMSQPMGVAACLLDLCLAAWVASGRWWKGAAVAQIATTAGFTLVIGAALPDLWSNPFGPLVKNLGILMTIGLWAATREEQ
ncbi:MAG: SDR family oxidoreductase [Alphaproteobacteria bacterium]